LLRKQTNTNQLRTLVVSGSVVHSERKKNIDFLNTYSYLNSKLCVLASKISWKILYNFFGLPLSDTKTVAVTLENKEPQILSCHCGHLFGELNLLD
jgi:acetone carboxylase gamma subunit